MEPDRSLYTSAKGKQKKVIQLLHKTNFDVVAKCIPEDLFRELDRDFTEDEKEKIFARIGLKTAPQGHARPVALWVFGPSAVGKTFLSRTRAAELFGNSADAVMIDGAEFREAHAGFQAVAAHGIANHVLHADAWDTLKNTHADASGEGAPNQLRARIIKQALAAKQHVIIPDCATNLKRVHGLMAAVAAAGYDMHAICLWAPLNETKKRGEPRSVQEGKQWSARGYPKAIVNTLKLAAEWGDARKQRELNLESVRMWDNTVFPSHEVSYEEFKLLVGMSQAEADQHAAIRIELAQQDHLEAETRSARPRGIKELKGAFQAGALSRWFGKTAEELEIGGVKVRGISTALAVRRLLDDQLCRGRVEGALAVAALVCTVAIARLATRTR